MGTDNVNKKLLEDYKKELNELLNTSQETFEKQLSYISSGAIGVSMLIVDKMFKDMNKTHCRILLTIGWVILAATLLLNLCSHLIAAKFHYSTIHEINCDKFDYEKVVRRNNITNLINWICAFLLFVGILLIIIFVSVNV